MKIHALVLAILAVCGVADPCFAAESDSQPESSPRFAIGFDAGDTLINGIVTAALPDAKLLVFPVDAHFSISPRFGISATIMIRHASSADHYRTTEFIYMAGPRLSLRAEGLKGGFATVKLGLGHDGGTDFDGRDYSRHDFCIQPEIGWAWAFGAPGFYMALSLGMRSQIPMIEKPASIPWDGVGKMSET